MPKPETAPAGYSHPDYAASLSEFGVPQRLDGSGGWILKRQIPGCGEWDAMGCYPLFACERWSRLRSDLDGLDGEIVSLSLVTDPFGDYDEGYLQQCFGEVVLSFKEHFVIDLALPTGSSMSRHHRRNAKKASEKVSVEVCDNPDVYAEQWCDLYANLTERHGIRGIAAFSRSSLVRQLRVPGMVAFRACSGEHTVGMLLWYVHRRVAYYHLGAYTEPGYRLRASFALFWFAIEYFAGSGMKWLALGAGAGSGSRGDDGLTRFKSGWATGTRTAYFCGRIYDRERYAELVRLSGTAPTRYFPAYRSGEFG